MCDMELKINGELLLDAAFREELEQAAIGAIMAKLGDKILAELSPAEKTEIVLNMLPSTPSDIRFETYSESHEIMNKIRAAEARLGIKRKSR